MPRRAEGRKAPERPSGLPAWAQPSWAPAFQKQRLISNHSDFPRKHTHLPAAGLLSEPVTFSKKRPPLRTGTSPARGTAGLGMGREVARDPACSVRCCVLDPDRDSCLEGSSSPDSHCRKIRHVETIPKLPAAAPMRFHGAVLLAGIVRIKAQQPGGGWKEEDLTGDGEALGGSSPNRRDPGRS